MTTPRMRKIVDEAGVDAVLDAAETFARERGHRVVIAVVDPSGELIQLRRTPGAQIASSRVAVDKARTAAIFFMRFPGMPLTLLSLGSTLPRRPCRS